MRWASLSIAALVAHSVCACTDPVHDDAVTALGSEAPGVPAGPEHRPGQPCLDCHGQEGPSSFEMSFGGTVYSYRDLEAPLPNATVRIVDATEHTYETTTNCAGNFWIPRREFVPVFPVKAAVSSPGGTSDGTRYRRAMLSNMNRDGNCGGCHTSPQNAGSPGHIWVLPDGITVADGGACR